MIETTQLESMDREARENFILKLVDTNIKLDKKIEYLKIAFEDTHDAIRIAAVKIVRKLNIESLFEDLISLFQQEKQWLVRYYILKTLNSINKEKAEKTLIEALKDKKPNIRILVLELLNLNNEDVVNDVINMTRDLDSRVSEKASKILENSANLTAKAFIEDRERKIREKEEKRRKMEEVFGDLIKSEMDN